MRKLFPVLTAIWVGAMSFGAPALSRRANSDTPQPLIVGPNSKGKGKGHGKHYPFSSTRQSRPKHRTAVVHGFPIPQRMNRQQIADLYRSSVL